MDCFEIKQLYAGYGRIKVLQGLDIVAKQSAITLLIGANGSGKTTLVRSMLGIAKVFSGSIWYGESCVSKMRTPDIVRLGIGVVPEGKHLFGNLTVYQNLEVALYSDRQRKNGSAREAAIKEALDQFPEVAVLRDRRVGSLSGGQQQMVALARAFVRKPKFLLLDEPSAGLAPKVIRGALSEVERLARANGIGVFLVEQSRLPLDMGIVDNVYVMAQGVIVTKGAAGELTKEDVERSYFQGSVR